MELSDNALKIYQRLYLAEDEALPAEVHARVARLAASVEKTERDRQVWERLYRKVFDENRARPASPVMMNAGLREKPVMSACFVGDLQDDLMSILDLDREAAIIFSYGAGIGINWGVLREKGAALSNGGVASGPVSFMRKLNSTAACVKSGGRARRAAIMSMIDDDHPDLEAFIECKKDRDLQAMNLSVAVTDAFMRAVESGEEVALRSRLDGSVVKRVKAVELFRQMCRSAHATGDPGLFFIDRANEDNPIPSKGRIRATNPCGELPLPPYGSCNLGSINLAAHVRGGTLDVEALLETVRIMTRFLDSIIDVSGYPTARYEERALYYRPLGLGIMGLADALAMCGLPYDSEQGRKFAGMCMELVTEQAWVVSRLLAEERGPAPAWSNDEDRDAFYRMLSRKLPAYKTFMCDEPVRNFQLTTIAPTGSISLSADCSSGMEPFFALVYDKILSDTGETLRFVNPLFRERYGGEPWFQRALSEIIENHGSCRGCPSVPEEVQQLWPVAHDIAARDRIEMQRVLQRHVTSAISSTVNLRWLATVEDIERIYMEAWKAGLKGITVFRDGCLGGEQPVVFGGKVDEKPRQEEGVSASREGGVSGRRERPSVLHGATHKIMTGHGSVYLTVNVDPETGEVVEVFTSGAKNGSVNAANLEAVARLISVSLQSGAPLERLVGTLEGINDGSAFWTRLEASDEKPVLVTSIPDAVAKVLRRFYVGGRVVSDGGVRCPECGGPAWWQEGCVFCPKCGSKCG